MFKQLTLAGAALAMGAMTMAPTAAQAQRYGDRYERSYDNGYNDRGYGDRYQQRRVYRGRDNGYRARQNYRGQRCDNGTGGTIIGALAGGLLGHTIAGRGDGTLGALLGAAGGGLAGRAIDRSDSPRNCRR